jgi:hypothetical protein
MVFHIHSHVVMLCCVAWGFIVPSFKGEDRRRFATICDDHAGDMAAYLIFWGKTWIIQRIFHGEPAWFIWMNYIDLAVTSLEWWFGFGESSSTNIISALFRSVNCCTLNQNTGYISRITSLIDDIWWIIEKWVCWGFIQQTSGYIVKYIERLEQNGQPYWSIFMGNWEHRGNWDDVDHGVK